MRPEVFFLLFLLNTQVFCQDKTIVHGSVSDQHHQQLLIGATVYLSGSNYGSLTNEKGVFSLTLKPGMHKIVASYLGYRSDTIEIDTRTTRHIEFRLQLASIQAEEIVVTAKNKSENVTGIETGEVNLTMRDIKQLPALMGEADFMRVIQLTPGVSAANDGNSGFYVRGGGADQNLILFDNATVYNPSHVLGFFSIFNARATSGARLIKSGMPAEYGGRLSSIVSFTGLEGNTSQHNIHGNIGLLSTSLSIEGPLANEKFTYLLAARRSYIDEVLKPALRPFVNEGSSFYNYSKYHFYDLNLKLSFKPGQKDKITLTGYKGADKYSLEEYQLDFNNKMSWGNAFATLNWTHSFDQKWVLHTHLSVTEYNFTLDASQRNVIVGFFSGVSDVSMKMALSYAGEKG
ncbi:MAG: TonB-dependent receptor [Bacteroidota bacterium]|nr:MAG: TonB-dependent receptor [Bacteroidota bacterium]